MEPEVCLIGILVHHANLHSEFRLFLEAPLSRLILQSRSHTAQDTITVLTIKQLINWL